MASAVSSMDAARLLADARIDRSSISRAYYAAFAAAHALLIHLGETPRPELGTWSHADLPQLLRTALSTKSVSRIDPRAAGLVHNAMARCKTNRELADYGPTMTIDERSVRESIREAGRVLALAEGRIQ